MVGSRTIKTLAALVAAMTVGAFSLVLLQTGPIRPPKIPELAAQDAVPAEKIVTQTDSPIERGMWRNIVLHGPGEGLGVAEKCHFVADGARLIATDHWKRQFTTNHVVAYVRGHDYNADSVGVFVTTDFPQGRPSKEESEKLANLVRLIAALQETCRIDRGRVYFHSDLNPYIPAPDEGFAKWLTAQLPRIER